MKRGIREERMEKWVEQQGVGRKGETAESKEQVICSQKSVCAAFQKNCTR